MKGIMVDDSYDLKIEVKRDANNMITGGLVIGDTTFQNQEFIILAGKGEFKEEPLKGVSIHGFLDDETPESLIRAIRTELSEEGMKVKEIGFENGKLVIDAKYNN